MQSPARARYSPRWTCVCCGPAAAARPQDARRIAGKTAARQLLVRDVEFPISPIGSFPRRSSVAHSRRHVSTEMRPTAYSLRTRPASGDSVAPTRRTPLAGPRRARELLDGARGDDTPPVHVFLVIAFHVAEIVDVVHHEAEGLREAPVGGVRHPVEPFEARAVAEVESRHRVERLAVLPLLREIPRGQ